MTVRGELQVLWNTSVLQLSCSAHSLQQLTMISLFRKRIDYTVLQLVLGSKRLQNFDTAVKH